MMDLNTIWFGLVGVLLIGYAILDGFDLGVGKGESTAMWPSSFVAWMKDEELIKP